MIRQQQVEARADLRVRLEAEAKNTKLNQSKILNQWRKIMRLAKSESLKKDIEILSQNHERDVDRKDAILQMLDRFCGINQTFLLFNRNCPLLVFLYYRDLEEAEDQFQMALRSHLSNVDSIIQLHDNRLYALERAFQQEVKTMQDDFNRIEKGILVEKFVKEKADLKAIIDAIEQEEQVREADAKYTFEQLREEIRNRALEDINMLRISLDAQIEDLENHFETAHLNYLQQTAQRTHDFKELTQTDQALSKNIEGMRKKVDSLQTSIQHWRAKSRQLSRETEERNRLLLQEKHTIQKHYQQLKLRIKTYRSSQTQRLLQLSQNANICMTRLTQKLDIARAVLQVTELARRFETDTEKVRPFSTSDAESSSGGGPASSPNRIEEQKIEEYNEVAEEAVGFEEQVSVQAQKTVHINPLQSATLSREGGYVPPSERLSNFYLKYNRILLDCIAIEKEQDRLAKENAQLEDLIQQYMDGTKLSSSILDEDNPLFVVNGRANLNQALPVREIRPTVQDATNIQSTVQRQRAF